MRASLTLLDSKKAGSQTEPFRPLLDKMWISSGAVLQKTVKRWKTQGAEPQEAKDAEERKSKAPGSEAGSQVKRRPRGHPPSTKVDEEKVDKPEQGEIKPKEGEIKAREVCENEIKAREVCDNEIKARGLIKSEIG